MFRILACLAMLLVGSARTTHSAPAPGGEVRWRRAVLDTAFRSEGVAVADVNRDGKPDVIAGNLWYEAPAWAPHEIAPAVRYDGAIGYSNSFVNFAADLNHDGWPDQILIGMPGDKAVWRENPGKRGGPWAEHIIWRSACNETQQFADLLRTGRRLLVFPYDEKTMAYYTPTADPTAEFVAHDVSAAGQPGTARFSHGLGVGDVNGDGRPDIITSDGYYEGPAAGAGGLWRFVACRIGGPCAHLYAYDVNADGLPDVISTSAHGAGVWWHEQRKTPGGPEFVQHTIDDSITQTHAAELVDINGDGLKDIVTGKRHWAHGPSGDIRPGDPSMVVWYELRRKGHDVTWTRHTIDEDSGVGTQFAVADMNGDGRPDVVTSNKNGVFVFIQVRGR